MLRSFPYLVFFAVVACGPQPTPASNGPAGGQVEIAGFRRVEASEIIATGGSFRDPSDPYWQVIVNSSEIALHGAAASTPPETVFPPVQSIVTGDTETWISKAHGETVIVRAKRERCVRPDGFVFRQRVTLEVKKRTFTTCAKRGSDPEVTKD
jgi:hypothetical protein